MRLVLKVLLFLSPMRKLGQFFAATLLPADPLISRPTIFSSSRLVGGHLHTLVCPDCHILIHLMAVQCVAAVLG